MLNLESERAIRVRKEIVRAISDYNLIESHDRLMVCVSGGKDSAVMLVLLKEIARRAERKFTLEAVLLDQKQPGFSAEAFRHWVESLGIPLTILERDTYSIVTDKIKDGTYCSLCSRLRRAILYDYASEKGFSKVVLGHHRDDFIETALLNLFYTGKISAMPPKLRSDDGRNILIRPMAYVAESDLAALAQDWRIPLIPCNLCGSQDGLKRKRMKKLVGELELEIPNIRASILTALGNIKPSQMMDRRLWDFDSLRREDENESCTL
ncbi:MAG: tRNA 2-thiocytidine(32) synthetase TtcA [Bdellovibrionaceae bacterium]|nr:tRNA 2-thiocytidine(32) synthetase TtcA [Pseudobdellovibrionaceae bacterium]